MVADDRGQAEQEAQADKRNGDDGHDRLLVAGLVVLAAAVRFPLLGAKSYWGDEISTLFLVQHSFSGMFAGIAQLESTPPLYYVLAKLWHTVAGSGEEGMRSLPALLGVGAVPVAYAAAKELVSRRAAAIAGVLLAVNPMLVWYSGEARSYSLAVFLGAVGLWLFTRALRGGSRALAAWSAASILALATHYFCVFLVVPEAVVLLARSNMRRRALHMAIGAVGCGGLALLPLAAEQRSFGHAAWIERTALVPRLLRTPVELLVGFDAPHTAVVGGVALALAAGGAWLAWTQIDALHERRGVATAALLGLAAIAVPAAIAAVGLDYFDSRNVLAAVIPLTIVVAAGFAALSHIARVTVVSALFAVFLGVVVTTATEPKYHSEDWRSAARALGDDAKAGRVVLVTPGQAGRKPLMVYLGEGTRPIDASNVRVAEVDVLVAPRQGASDPSRAVIRRAESLRLVAFRQATRRRGRHYVVIRLRARGPERVAVRSIALRLGRVRAAALLER